MKLSLYLYLVSAIAAALSCQNSMAQLVAYDNWAPSGWDVAYPTATSLSESASPTDEFGDEIVLAPGTPRQAQEFSFQYFADNSAGNLQVTVRFYLNDGPLTLGGPLGLGGFSTPGTLLYNSGSVALPIANGSASLTLKDIQVAVPDMFTWTLQFSGLSSGQAVGTAIQGTQAVGASDSDFWEKTAGQWNLYQFTQPPQPGSFGALLTVVPEPPETATVLLTGAVLGAMGLRAFRCRRA